MDTFNYTVLSKEGKKISGIIEGYNQMDAAARLKENYPIVLKLDAVGEKGVVGNFLGSDIGGKRLNDKAFTLMCSQFAVILKSGIPIARTVRLIAQKMTDKTLKSMLGEVANDVESGRSLSTSFAERGKGLLPITFLETIHAGEEAGNLDTAFESVSEHYTKQVKLKGKVRGAMIYPTFVMILAVVVVIVLMVKVVPTFTAIFEEQGSELPWMTQSLIDVSLFFRTRWYIMLIVIAAIVLIIKLYGNTEDGRIRLAKLKLKLPVLGEINVLSAASEFTNTMAMMLGAGLPITKAVNITSRVISNYWISTEVGKISADLEVGQSLGRSLREAACLPDILNDMAAVGEESGELEQTLTMTAEYYDNELEAATAAALAKLEPITLVFMGAVAGYIVIAIYLAMFSMYNGM
ncbi:MAG: type II secretion system F family protein [Mogibacterium sp.]|nr:type II secretion system F family protein [Mogibacterium sp.]